MSLFKQSTHKTIDSDNISFNMPNSDIFYTDIKKNTLNKNIKNYYEISYNKNAVIFQSSLLASRSYIAKKIYLFGLLHKNIDNLTNISNTDIVGELIIEHEDNNKSKLFTCFLLKKNLNSNAATIITENPDKIDDIIDFIINYGCKNCPSKLTNVKFNNILIPSTSVNNKFIYYKDKKKNNIFVFLTPIDIVYNENASFVSNLLDTIELSNKSDKKEAFSDLLDKSYIKEAFTESMLFDTNAPDTTTTPSTASSSNVTSEESIECELVGVGTENTPIDQLSINALTNELNRNIDLMKIGIYFFSLLVLIMITYSIVPYLFNIIIVFNTKDNKPPDNNRMTGIFIISTNFIILFCFLLFYLGFEKNNISIIFVGFIVALLYILSILVIITKYQTISFSFSFAALETLILECVKFTLSNIIPKYIGMFIVTIILIAIVLTIQKQNLKKTYGDTVAVWSILLIPITIIISIISYSPKIFKDS